MHQSCDNDVSEVASRGMRFATGGKELQAGRNNVIHGLRRRGRTMPCRHSIVDIHAIGQCIGRTVCATDMTKIVGHAMSGDSSDGCYAGLRKAEARKAFSLVTYIVLCT